MAIDITKSGNAQAVSPISITKSGNAQAVSPISITKSGDAVASPFSLVNIYGDAFAVNERDLELSGDAVALYGIVDLDISGDAMAVHLEEIPTDTPNPHRPCPNALKSCLPCNDDPISNYSSEDLDADVFCATATYRNVNPPLGQCGGIGGQDLACTAFCCSEISQEDAELCALRKAQECVLGGEA